ncbi:hypothetical protein CKO25_18610 [Thiocapsa imhoffii]|uniref:Uncharacterized protein n=1 Tax=Thiocapsa imhoffii TaxID=382777 RepID=A0A9X0WMD9_9GAMM|nr:hypothetical protein [Thiocapsa imhoffii]MBK1646612.1 hypothetical protein [Thiocapsa imhoffii]
MLLVVAALASNAVQGAEPVPFAGDWVTSQGQPFQVSDDGLMTGLRILVETPRNCGTNPGFITAAFPAIRVDANGAFRGARDEVSDGNGTRIVELSAGRFPLAGERVDLPYRWNIDIRTGSTTGSCSVSLSAITSLEVVKQTSSLRAAVLPSTRAVAVDTTASVFATLINGAAVTARDCGVALPRELQSAFEFTYQTTDPANRLTGRANDPVDIAAGASQGFVVAIRPKASLNNFTVPLIFRCAGEVPAPSQVGLNTLSLTAARTPPPDVVPIAVTPSADGVLRLPHLTGVNVIAASAINIGAAGVIGVSADDAGQGLPLRLQVCEIDVTGQVLNCGPRLARRMNPREIAYFSVVVSGQGESIAFDPVSHRIFLRFASDDVTVGATSVAVTTH